MPDEQDQDRADGRSHQRTKESEHGNVQDTGQHSSHEGASDPNQYVGEDAVPGLGHPFGDPPGNCADQQHLQKADDSGSLRTSPELVPEVGSALGFDTT